MRLGGLARYACEVTSEDELLAALLHAQMNTLAVRAIGIGSNIVWQDDGFPGLLIINKIEGFEILEDGLSVRIGAGMNWDDAVKKSVEAGLSGLEFLSLIPGTAGATPVQNVGAYGREIKDVLISVRAYDTQIKKFVDIWRDDCVFGYRTSRFKTNDEGRFIITYITLQLSNEAPKPPFYESLQAYLDERQISEYTAEVIRNAVVAIRSSKLPDPALVANNGSFFANPVIPNDQFEKLQATYPEIKGWAFEGKTKIAAGWLVENVGFKDFHDQETGIATWHSQSIALINEHAQSTADLLKFKQKIVNAVQEKFGITLEQEPELLP